MGIIGYNLGINIPCVRQKYQKTSPLPPFAPAHNQRDKGELSSKHFSSITIFRFLFQVNITSLNAAIIVPIVKWQLATYQHFDSLIALKAMRVKGFHDLKNCGKIYVVCNDGSCALWFCLVKMTTFRERVTLAVRDALRNITNNGQYSFWCLPHLFCPL